MSRIEKGAPRFRPTVVARRAPLGEGAAASTPAPAAPLATPAAAPTSAPTSAGAAVPPTHRGGGATIIVPRTPSASAGTSSAVPSVRASSSAPIVPTARSYAFATPSAPTSAPKVCRRPLTQIIRGPGQAPISSTPAGTGTDPAPSAPALSPYERFLHAAQADPRGVLQLDRELDPSSVADMAAEMWQIMSTEHRAAYGAASTTAAPRPRVPRRRAATSISDDEAEYERQCAQQESGGTGHDLPPLRVDIGTTRMESIAVTNWKSGRASSRTFELERVRARQLKKRREESAVDGETTIKASQTPTPRDATTPRDTPAPMDAEPQFHENRLAVQTRIVDGKIVLDEQSLFANYRDDELHEREQRNWEVIDEREGDQFINSASRSKQRRTQRWSADETERFFHAVSQWGTDFEMITRLFPRRTRREIKAKWTKESRDNPARLDHAFQRRVKVDLRAYGQAAGVDLSGPPPAITAPSDAEPGAGAEEEEVVQ